MVCVELWCIQTSIVLHRPTLVFCMATHVTRTNIHNVQNCCERLASTDVNQCTVMKSECTLKQQGRIKVMSVRFHAAILWVQSMFIV